MKVNECNEFNPEFPETFNWGIIDSIILTNVTDDIILQIKHDLHTLDRNLTPGLRQALCIISRHAII